MVKSFALFCCAVWLGAAPSWAQQAATPAAASSVAQEPVPRQLTLAAALQLADARNPRLAAARAGIAIAEADKVSAGRRPTPALTFDSIGDYPFRSSAVDQHEYLIRADQEIETAGRRGLRLAAADLGVNTASATFDDERRKVLLEVKRAYLEAALAKANREVAQSTLTEIDSLIKLNRARFEAGEISGAEPRRLQVERLRFVDDLFSADLAFRNARSALLALLNATDLAQDIDPVDPLVTPGAGPPVAPLLTAALANVPVLRQGAAARPELAAARSEEARAQTETRLQRALRTPNITVGGGYSHLGGLNVAAFGVTVPLTFLSRNTGAVARADAEYQQAVQRRLATIADVELDVQRTINAAQVNRARVDYIEKEHLASAREAREIVLASYRLGEVDLIDFLDAQRAFRDTQRTYNRALFDERLSLFELEAAVGTGALSLQGR